MTASALLVLFLALVSSVAFAASVDIDDYEDLKQENHIGASQPIRKYNYDTNLINTLRTKSKLNVFSKTNIGNDTINIYIDEPKDITSTFDEIYTASVIYQKENLELRKLNLEHLEYKNKLIDNRQYNRYRSNSRERHFWSTRMKREGPDKCETFNYSPISSSIQHPHSTLKKDSNYYSNMDCVTVINSTKGNVIEVTFVDIFHIEDHPNCAHDYLEIRDGAQGYAKLLAKLCGDIFPTHFKSTGPYMWLKFHSDDTIEYEGFHINVNIIETATSRSIPDDCVIVMKDPTSGTIDSSSIDKGCLDGSVAQPLDVLWKITTGENTKIYLNFTYYSLEKPNDCTENFVQVFGAVLQDTPVYKLADYCGSVANPVTTKDGPDQNVMHVRLYASLNARGSSFKAVYTAFRTLDPSKQDECTDNEFDCDDNTCIDISLRCDKSGAHCRLKTDQDNCSHTEESIIGQPRILIILVIFSLILSGMSFVFLFKCIRKLYQDHKIIKEQIRQSCEDRLDNIASSRLTLDAKRLRQDSEPRASLERENHTNEMFKRQRSFPHQPTSLDSDLIQETQLDLDDDIWRREVENVTVEPEEVRIERNGRQRRSDLSKKEESLRREQSEKEEVRKQKDIRDASVGAPDTKESGCQTRESLFQAGAGSDGTGTESGSGSRGFSTFGYSGATIARPSPPPAAKSQITIELMKPSPAQSTQSKKRPERRPISNETTRSAPDVIIVSKPVR